MRRLFQLALGATLAVAIGTAAKAQDMTEVMVAKPDVAALPGVTLNPALAATLPEAIRTSGVLKVATSLAPPISFHDDDGKLIGIDAGLASAFGIILGVAVEMTDVGGGPHIVPAILSGRFDRTISGINDTAMRPASVPPTGRPAGVSAGRRCPISVLPWAIWAC